MQYEPAAPMPARLSARAIYDVLDTFDGDQGFVGVMSDSQWKVFCESFGRMLRSGQQRVAVCWLQPITPHLAAFARKSSRPVISRFRTGSYGSVRASSRGLAHPVLYRSPSTETCSTGSKESFFNLTLF